MAGNSEAEPLPGGSHTAQRIREALEEDLGYRFADQLDRTSGDITTRGVLPDDRPATAFFLAKTQMVLCGMPIAAATLRELDPRIALDVRVAEGTLVMPGTVLATVSGSLWAILAGERTALNFIQRLSGIATLTNSLVTRIAHTPCALLDTRKTTPTFRDLERYAVRTGGGTNHRFGLFDQVLIKNNHIDALGGDVREAIRRARKFAATGTVLEVEVRTLAELRAAAEARPDIILLDNMVPTELRTAIQELRRMEIQEPILTEASGGIHEGNIVAYAETGVDRISLGALTHSVRSADISLRFGEPQ